MGEDLDFRGHIGADLAVAPRSIPEDAAARECRADLEGGGVFLGGGGEVWNVWHFQRVRRSEGQLNVAGPLPVANNHELFARAAEPRQKRLGAPGFFQPDRRAEPKG